MLRVFFYNGSGQAEALCVTDAKLRTAFAGREPLLASLDYRIGNSDAEWPEHATESQVILTSRHVHFPAGRSHRTRWLQTMAAGVEDLSRSLPADVLLTNASGVHGDKGAEFILASVLMLNFDIPRFTSDKIARRWDPNFGGTVAGKTVVMVGVGAIGLPAARLLAQFGVHVIGVTRSGTPIDGVPEVVAAARIDDVLPRADVLVSTAPLTPETDGLVNANRLAAMPRGGGVVVVGRSRVLDYGALRRLLAEGHLGGAVLDVFDTEPLHKDDAIWDCPNLVITPHCSLDDHSVYLQRCLELFVDNLQRFTEGRELRNVVNRALGY